MKTFSQFLEQSSGRSPYQTFESTQGKEYEETRHEDDVYQTTTQKLQNPRLRKLRRFFNREVGRYTV